MRITRGTGVGLRVLMMLAHSDAPKVSISQLAVELNLPERHVGKIVQVLSKHGWVATLRGRTGGVVITPGGLAASADTILTAVEGAAPLLNCYDPPCPFLEQGCELKRTLDLAQAAFRAELGGRTIRDLVGSKPGPLPADAPPTSEDPPATEDPPTSEDPPATEDAPPIVDDSPRRVTVTRRPRHRVPVASGV